MNSGLKPLDYDISPDHYPENNAKSSVSPSWRYWSDASLEQGVLEALLLQRRSFGPRWVKLCCTRFYLRRGGALTGRSSSPASLLVTALSFACGGTGRSRKTRLKPERASGPTGSV